MAGVAKIVCVIFYYLFILLSFISADLGFAIYNGMYWSEIRNIFSKVEPGDGCQLSVLPLLTMLTWILCIVVPAIGPLFPAIMIILATAPNKCEESKQHFINQALTNTSELSPVWANYMQENGLNSTDWCNLTWFDDWFHDHCNRPSLINFIFASIVIFAIFVIVVRTVYRKCCARRRSYEQF